MKAKDKSSSLDWERLNQICDVFPETGQIFWREPTGKRASFLRGKLAGHSGHAFGYVMICIDGVDYKRHRLVWFAVHKKWPAEELDHINGDRADDRIENLREASKAQNMWNAKTPVTNVSGRKGVSWYEPRKCWRVTIRVNGKPIYGGKFKSLEAAKGARERLEKKYHGSFSRGFP